jgi:hypothetical protein
MRQRRGKYFSRSLPSQETQRARRRQRCRKKRKRPDSVRVIGRSSNSPPPKSAQELLYVLIAAEGMARTGDSCGQSGRPGRNRTCNRRIRNPMLYPFELRAQSIVFLSLPRSVNRVLRRVFCGLFPREQRSNVIRIGSRRRFRWLCETLARPRGWSALTIFATWTQSKGEMFDTVQCLRYCSNSDSA